VEYRDEDDEDEQTILPLFYPTRASRGERERPSTATSAGPVVATTITQREERGPVGSASGRGSIGATVISSAVGPASAKARPSTAQGTYHDRRAYVRRLPE
jgi:hypothetical protein